MLRQDRESVTGFDAKTMNECRGRRVGLRVTSASRNRWWHGVEVRDRSPLDFVRAVVGTVSRR